MKYIKTQIGTIEELLEENEDYIKTCQINAFDDYAIKTMKKSWAVKTADKIEDLFDRFVIRFDYKDSNVTCFIEFGTCKRALEYLDLNAICFGLEDDVHIYGAIWTDHGLLHRAELMSYSTSGKTDWVLL